MPRSNITLWALPLTLVACQAPPPQIFPSLVASTEVHGIVDVAVLPIEDRTAERNLGALLDHMRERVASSLPKRKYSPMGLAYIDRVLADDAPETSIIEASWLRSFGGRFDDDSATLAIRLTTWDETSLMANGRVRFAADVRMVSPKSETPVWAGDISGEVKAGGAGPAPRGLEQRARAAAIEFADALIRLLPPRYP